jgi:glycosyltransferase involved in cell wall biosynthesis
MPILAVASPDSELACVIEEEQIGWVVSSNDPQDVVRVIEEAAVNRDLLSKMSSRARLAVEKKYSLEVIIPKFRDMFLEMA